MLPTCSLTYKTTPKNVLSTNTFILHKTSWKTRQHWYFIPCIICFVSPQILLYFSSALCLIPFSFFLPWLLLNIALLSFGSFSSFTICFYFSWLYFYLNPTFFSTSFYSVLLWYVDIFHYSWYVHFRLAFLVRWVLIIVVKNVTTYWIF